MHKTKSKLQGLSNMVRAFKSEVFIKRESERLLLSFVSTTGETFLN